MSDRRRNVRDRYYPEPPAGLHDAIMATIALRARRALKIRMIFSGALSTVSLWIAWIGWTNLSENLSRSGFLAFGSLFFSDFSLASAHFSDVAFSMLESFPVFSAAFMLSGILFSIWSFASFVDGGISFRKMHRMITQ